jgi:FkbM family methyltransferase
MITPVSIDNINFNMCVPENNLLVSYPGGNVQIDILNTKCWAKDETLILNTILNKYKGLVIDVGANTGYFSFIALINKCNVIAIEPNPIHTKYFNKTLEINNFNNKVIHLEKFVSTKKNCIFDGWTGNENLLSKNTYEHTIVDSIMLDDICDDCVFLKIDVEGNEPDVIKSAKKLLSNDKIKYIMFEITYIMNNSIDYPNIEMLQILNNHGFTLYEIEPNTLIQINNIQDKLNTWSYEYFNNHKIFNPNLTNAGSNILAIHKNSENLFRKIDNTNDFYIK